MCCTSVFVLTLKITCTSMYVFFMMTVASGCNDRPYIFYVSGKGDGTVSVLYVSDCGDGTVSLVYVSDSGLSPYLWYGRGSMMCVPQEAGHCT